MHKYLVEMLECPECHDSLDWAVTEQSADRIVSAQARCHGCSGVYFVKGGVGVFLASGLTRKDMWKQVDTGLESLLSQHPELEESLMGVPLDTLSPVDQHYRGVILENRGDVEAANIAYASSRKAMYSADTIRCMHRQMDCLLEEVSRSDGPIVDLASGECILVRRMLSDLSNPVVVTDFSPGVLLRNQKRLLQQGLYDRVSLLAFDARRTPFRTGSVESLTTFLGLANIQDPGNLLGELKRTASGRFMAVTSFYPEDDSENGEVIRNAGLAEMLYRNRLLKHYEAGGWKVKVRNSCNAWTDASPTGIVLKGAKVDLLPACSTSLEWCVLSATSV
jgi:uncharacterized protein YbaR (Trm112 family)